MAFSRLDISTKSIRVTSILKLENTLLKRRFVPPYTSSPTMMLSPLLRSPAMAVMAPKPEENVKPYEALSNLAKTFSRTFLVGFPDLPYSYC